MLKHAWSARQDQQAAQSKHIRAIDTQIQKLLDRIMASESKTVIAAIEKRIETLETEKKILVEKQAV